MAVIVHMTVAVVVIANLGSSQILSSTKQPSSTSIHVQHGSTSPPTPSVSTSPSPECSDEINACLQALISASGGATSLEDFCAIISDYWKCLLNVKQCPEAYITETIAAKLKVIPDAANSFAESGITCDFFPTSPLPSNSISSSPTNHVRHGSTSPSTPPGFVLPSQASSPTNHVQHGSTSPSTPPGFILPSQECLNEVQACSQSYSTAAQGIRTLEDYCRITSDYLKCLMDTKQCPEAFIRDTMIPQIMNATQSSNIDCDFLPTSPMPSNSISSSTTNPVQDGSTSPATTPGVVLPSQECLNEVQACAQSYSSAAQGISSLEAYCSITSDYLKCLMDTKQCPEAFIRDTVIPQTINATQSSNIDCDFLSTSPTPGNSISSSTTNPVQNGSTSPATPPGFVLPSQECLNEVQACTESYSSAAQGIRTLEDYCSITSDYLKCFMDTKQCPEAFIRDTLIPQIQNATRGSNITCDTSTHSPTALTSPTTPPTLEASEECFLEVDACNAKLAIWLEDASTIPVVCGHIHEFYKCLIETDACSWNFIYYQLIVDIDNGLSENDINCGIPTFSPPVETVTPSATPAGQWTTPKQAVNGTTDWKDACAVGLQACDDFLLSEAATVSPSEFCPLIARYVDCHFDIEECDRSFIRNVTLPNIKSTITNCHIPALDDIESVPFERGCLVKYEVCEEEYVVSSIGYPRSSYCMLLEDFAKCILAIDECDKLFFRENTIPRIIEDAAEKLGLECVLSAVDLGDSIAGEDNPDGRPPTNGNTDKGHTGSISCLYETQTCSEDFTSSALKVAASELCGVVNEYVICMRKIDQCSSTFINNRINTDVGPNLAACERDERVTSGQLSLREQLHGSLALLIFIALCLTRLY